MVSSTFGNFGTRVVLVLAAAGFSVAHFTLQGPAPSREKQAYSSNERFYPIGGSNVVRPKLDCLEYPRGKVASLLAGSTTKFTYEIGASASHVGMCTAQLLDATTGQLVADLGQQNNCVSGPRAMTITLPNKNCASCVVKIKVTATHASTTNPEYYDSCVDVNISGGTGAAAVIPDASTPSSRNVAITAVTSPEAQGGQDAVLATNEKQAKFPATTRNKRSTDRRDDNQSKKQDASQNRRNTAGKTIIRRPRAGRINQTKASTASGSTEAATTYDAASNISTYETNVTSAINATDATIPTQAKYFTSPAASTKNDGNPPETCSAATNGNWACSEDGTIIFRCDWTKWVSQNVPAGTACAIDANGNAFLQAK